MPPEHELQPWPLVESRREPHMVLFRPRWDTLTNPRTGADMERLVLEMPDWVNVVALTPEREVVCVRQYRFGTSTLSLEIPGGVVDPGEEHEDAARRELREETGHTGGRWTYLGAVEPNPAFQDNLCHHWLAEDVELTHALELDSGEDILVERHAPETVLGWIADGTLRHSLVVSAMSRVFDLRTHPDHSR